MPDVIPGVPVVVTADGSVNIDNAIPVDSPVELVLRARASNVQAIAVNIGKEADEDPEGAGERAFVLFPGESIRFELSILGLIPYLVKFVAFNFDPALPLPVLEIITKLG